MTIRTPYGRRAVEVLGSVPPDEAPPTYYNRPAVKPSDWRWLIITYFFVGGLAGAAQVIATVAELFGHRRDRELVGAARYLAVAGALASPVLLVADLKTPSRWYNMLRIFRGTSPMSIGSWTLLAFGTFSGLAAFGHLLEDLFGVRAGRALARLAGVPAAISGALLATYTGSLLSATSTPLWAAGYRVLPALFGASATSTAMAALALMLHRTWAPRASLERIERLSLLASALELVLSLRFEVTLKQAQVSTPLEEPPLAVPYRGGAFGLGILLPLAIHFLQVITHRELRTLSMVASIAALTGGYAQRAVLVLAGKHSAERPTDYFTMAR